MIAILALLAQAAPAQVAPPVSAPVIQVPTTAPAVPLAPRDWSVLPLLRLREPSPELGGVSPYVSGEIAANRCAASVVRTAQGWSLRIELAVLVAPTGRLRRVTPRAIDCPTVEQYAAGLILGTARDAIDTHGATSDAWYRTSVTFVSAA